jgi:hypothetical protein
MATQKKSTDERLEALRQKQDTLKARLAALETQKKAEERRRESRRAFVVGAAALANAETDPAFRNALRKVLEASVTREGDKAVIADLLGLSLPTSAPSKPASKTDAA